MDKEINVKIGNALAKIAENAGVYQTTMLDRMLISHSSISNLRLKRSPLSPMMRRRIEVFFGDTVERIAQNPDDPKYAERVRDAVNAPQEVIKPSPPPSAYKVGDKVIGKDGVVIEIAELIYTDTYNTYLVVGTDTLGNKHMTAESAVERYVPPKVYRITAEAHDRSVEVSLWSAPADDSELPKLEIKSFGTVVKGGTDERVGILNAVVAAARGCLRGIGGNGNV